LNLYQSIILGIVQGLTEFLPVSSSGHLVIASKLLNLPSNVPFDVALHFATLLAVCVYFAPEIFQIIKAFLTDRSLKNPYFKLGMLVIAGSIPTAIIGFSLSDIFEGLFSSLLAVGIFLIITGILIMIAESYGKSRKDINKISFMDSLIIGIAQGCAIAPGLSRSGTTISASLLLGLERPLAARFAFLLSIPAILGASIFKSKAILNNVSVEMIAGSIAAAVTGYIAIWAFMGLIQKKSIRGFAYYCFVLGAISFILGYCGR
jgi:undecaprenyl-diphosphatase